MAILLARSWEMGNDMLNSVDKTGSGSWAGATTAQAKTGNYSLFVGGDNSMWCRWALSGTPSAPSLSAWIRHGSTFNSNGNGTNYCNLRWLLTSGEYIDLRWNGVSHTFDAYVDGALVAAGTIEVSVNDWFHVQWFVQVANAGSIQVLIDGHESIDYSGDTQPGATDTVTYLYATGGSGTSPKGWYIDNLVVAGGDGLLGDLRSYEKRPDADDATAQWTPSAGADNYAMEDETPNSDADYNEAATNGLIDQFELDALDVTGLTVEAVIAWSRAKMTDGTGDSIDVGINSGGTASVKRSALSAAWEYYWGDVEEVDPADSAAWNQAKLDALLHRKVAVIT